MTIVVVRCLCCNKTFPVEVPKESARIGNVYSGTSTLKDHRFVTGTIISIPRDTPVIRGELVLAKE